MKKLIVLAVAALFATSAFAGDMKWNGSAGMRHDRFTYDDGLSSLDTLGQGVSKQYVRDYSMRANVGATGGSGNVDYGFDLRTGGAGTQNSDWVTFSNAGDRALALDQAWFSYNHDFGMFDVVAIFGRQKSAIIADDAAELLFSKDVRFDGFGWNIKAGSFGVNAAQYIFGAKTQGGAMNTSNYNKTDSSDNKAANQSRISVLYAWQPYMNWKFTDEISTKLAVGYYVWANVENTNATHGGYNSALLNAGSVPADASVNLAVNNPRQWHFYNTWDLPFNLGFAWEYIMNKKQYWDSAPSSSRLALDRSAFTAGLTYGHAKKAHDWMVGYNYASRGLASSVNAYGSERFLADNKGHIFVAKYNLADNFQLGFKGIWMKEKAAGVASNGANGNPTGAGNALVALKANQLLKTNYWELNAGVNF